MEEEAKAVQEVAKAIAARRELGEFLSRYVGRSIEQAIGIFEEELKYRVIGRKRPLNFLCALDLSRAWQTYCAVAVVVGALGGG